MKTRSNTKKVVQKTESSSAGYLSVQEIIDYISIKCDASILKNRKNLFETTNLLSNLQKLEPSDSKNLLEFIASVASNKDGFYREEISKEISKDFQKIWSFVCENSKDIELQSNLMIIADKYNLSKSGIRYAELQEENWHDKSEYMGSNGEETDYTDTYSQL